ncbi:hypothetical protein DFQ59_11526 [Thioalbus denitrificans]|uniref:Putative phosphoenolpyruvate synthase regulatory protein n=1 Tax=Thioalbus denitrificans TaxID=547122 RepID=A0A369BWL3_9GAMM|nr:pyruvate, water dikinase regulatory protein [Thioalbus denitrificans]RCX24807.1 hypothetical protein DFQ59_11526 [Thioalbus denitrificans]
MTRLQTVARTVFFISDRTGITSETLGHSLLTQFENIEFNLVRLPYLDTPEKARKLVRLIEDAHAHEGQRPIVFSTLLDDEIRVIVSRSQALMLDFFDTFIGPLEQELGVESTHKVGRSHGVGDFAIYNARIEAVNYALAHDDGVSTQHYGAADIILLGVSRSGKTPTCLYLALQFGVRAANYPLTEEDLDRDALPSVLIPYKKKLFGLLIDARRLQQIREQRRPNSRYASPQQCRDEVRRIQQMFRSERMPFIDTTNRSIEEIATTVMAETGIQRQHF